jgi:zinc resistance-associated protein
MRKGVIVSLIAASVLIFVSAVYAHWPGGGYGTCQFQNSDLDSVKKFQKETLPLRDELITKRLELRKEFSREKLDRERISAIQKEMIDIRTKIHQKADETGVQWQKSGRKGCGRMPGKGIMRGCQNPVGL